MHVSYGLPTHRVDRGDEFLAPGAIGELARAAEDAGFGAVYTTDHPFPGDDWLAHGGHHALDPLVALSFAAAATSTVRLHTNLFIVAYRNPFLAAKGIATLDVLSGGRRWSVWVPATWSRSSRRSACPSPTATTGWTRRWRPWRRRGPGTA